MTGTLSFVVAVLAGGEGSRLGGGKPLIKLGGRTLIERAFDRARSWSSSPVIAVRSPDQLEALQLPWIADAAGIAGPLAGLAAALEWAGRQGADGLLAIPCDMPFLPDDLARRLINEIADHRAAVASSGGELHPVGSFWRVEAITDFPAYCATGRRSLRGFAEHIGFAEVSWPTEPIDPFFNINTMDDLQKAELMLAN
jgi:molybdopterin-guanine dinucleotide biosynthesis protein A